MPALGAIGAISQVGGGIAGLASSLTEAQAQRSQAKEAMSEAQVNATNEAWNQTQFVGRQRLGFLANGVSLEGSPTEVLKSSKAYGQSMVDSIMAQGRARYSLGMAEANITRNKGIAALIGDTSDAAAKAYKAGMFDTPIPQNNLNSAGVSIIGS